MTKAGEFDKAFDEGKDAPQNLDLAKTKRGAREQKRVPVDFPVWMIQWMDREAKRSGVPRPSHIKVWEAERLERVV